MFRSNQYLQEEGAEVAAEVGEVEVVVSPAIIKD